jgi:hypothetical protein
MFNKILNTYKVQIVIFAIYAQKIIKNILKIKIFWYNIWTMIIYFKKNKIIN